MILHVIGTVTRLCNMKKDIEQIVSYNMVIAC